MNTITDTQTGVAIRRRRTHLLLSQKELADKLGTSQARISDLERGVAPVMPRMLQRIAVALDTTPEALKDQTAQSGA